MSGGVQTAAPRDIPRISALIGEFDGAIAYIAGGTDLVISLEHTPPPDLIIDISRIRDLAAVDANETHIRIGAGTTFTSLAKHPVIRTALPVLAEAARQVGSVQIRNRATLGGNIASAMPGGDLLPALKCLEARIEVLDRAGTLTTRGFSDIVIGAGTTRLNNGDLITGVSLPRRFGKHSVSAFVKIGRRPTLSIARLNLAAVVNYDRTRNRIEAIRLVAGAISPVPLRLHEVERALRGRIVDQSLADDFLPALAAAVDAAIPGRCSQVYKRRAVMGLGLDLLRSLFGVDFECAVSQPAPA